MSSLPEQDVYKSIQAQLIKDVAPNAATNTKEFDLHASDSYHAAAEVDREKLAQNAQQSDLKEMKSYKPSPLNPDSEKWNEGNAKMVHYPADSEMQQSLQARKDDVLKSKIEVKSFSKDEEAGNIDNDDNDDDDDDDDTDFDWYENPDEAKDTTNASLQRRSTSKRIRTAYNKYCCWNHLSTAMKRFIIAIVGSIIFITIAVCVYVYFPRPTEAQLADPHFTNIRSNVQMWMYWAAFMWHFAWFSAFIIEAIPYLVIKWIVLFRGRRSERVKTSLEYYRNLKKYIGVTVVLAVNWGTWAFFTHIPFPSVLKQPYTTTVWRIFACLFVASIFLLVQKTIIQMIATRFNRYAFNDRIKVNQKAIKVLDALGKAEARRNRATTTACKMRNRKGRPGFLNCQSSKQNNALDSGHSTSIAPSTITSDYTDSLRDQHPPSSSGSSLYSFRKNLKNAIFSSQPKETRSLKKNFDINSDECAKRNAKKLYIALAYPTGIVPADKEERRCLLLSDFEPYFKSAKETKAAFDIFDRNGNGDINRREFRDTVVYIYRERKDISTSMWDISQALGKVDYMLLAVTVVALILTSFAIFNVDVWRSLVPLGSILLGLTFVFGNTAKNTFESVLFLFVTHPYDVGDYVLVDGEYLLVHNLGVMGTTFISGDGQTVYAPTTVLMTKLITNVRRSGSTGETVTINVDFRTTSEQFWELHDRMSAWVASQSRDFGPGFDIRVADIIDVNQMILNIWLPHKGNWQELGKRHKRKTRFMLALKDVMMELDIRYELPAQRFTQSSANNNGGQEAPLFGTVNSVGHAQHLGVTPQSFTTQNAVPSNPKEAQLLKSIRRERAQRGGHDNVNYCASGPSGGGE